MPDTVTSPERVEEIADAIRRAGSVAIDLEFMPEGRYVPDLALVQVGWGDVESPEVSAIDPLAVDVRPIFDLVADPQVETLLHAAQGDLALLEGTYDVRGQNVWDTQIAAAFVGLGSQVGYGPLVDRVLGVRLAKGSQFTEWLDRPLSETQIEYALDDVRHLGALWAELRTRLEALGRLDWVQQECDALAEHADGRPPPDESYRRISGWRRLNAAAAGSLRAVAAWREHEARRTNRPTGRILNDRSLLELARVQPSRREQVAAVRGVDGGTARRHGDALLAAIEEGREQPIAVPSDGPRDSRVEVWATVLHGVVQGRALELDIAPRFLATRAELESFVDAYVGDAEAIEGEPLLNGWRGELIGASLLDWLRGDSSLIADGGDAAGLAIRPS